MGTQMTRFIIVMKLLYITEQGFPTGACGPRGFWKKIQFSETDVFRIETVSFTYPS